MNIETCDRRSVEESYISASNTSDLRVEADKRNTADVLIAAGWTPGVLGPMLMRLQSEWDGSSKPVKMTEAQILLMAAGMPREIITSGVKETLSEKEVLQFARADANHWHQAELQLLRLRLKSLGKVSEHLQVWAERAGARNPQRFAQIISAYWLDSNCPDCSGRGQAVIDGTPVLGEMCKTCHGTGKRKEPMGELGRKALDVMDEAVMTARNAMKKRLRDVNAVP